MKKLEALILDFYLKNKKDLENEYKWKVDSVKIPAVISRKHSDNNFELNLDLKEQLTRAFKVGNIKTQEELIHFYIYHWGGIRSNSRNTLEKYYFLKPENLISFGLKGISSWSKAITVHDYTKYAIFDARVSASLNGLQLSINNAYFFPNIASRNNVIKQFNTKIKHYAKRNSWVIMPNYTFYNEYLELLYNVSKNAGVSIAHIEMCLFAYAEKIVANKL